MLNFPRGMSLSFLAVEPLADISLEAAFGSLMRSTFLADYLTGKVSNLLGVSFSLAKPLTRAPIPAISDLLRLLLPVTSGLFTLAAQDQLLLTNLPKSLFILQK